MIQGTGTTALPNRWRDRGFAQFLQRIPRLSRRHGAPSPWAPLAILAAVFLIDSFLAYRHSGYTQLLSLYEREPIGAAYALEQAGILPETRVVPLKSGGQVLFFERGGKQILRIPYARGNATNRTHLAVRAQSDQTKVLVFDPMHFNPPLKAVFACGGSACEETSPDREDREILRALAAVDDRGTLMFWDLFFLLRPLIWVGLLFGLYRWQRETEVFRPAFQ